MGKNITDNILFHLKINGSITASELSEFLGVTKEGARQHLLKLKAQGLVADSVQKSGVGRPTTTYSLTQLGFGQFPDNHSNIAVQLLKSVKKMFGENALRLLLKDREEQINQRYESVMRNELSVEEKLDVLTKIRDEEGYIAEWDKQNDTYSFIENHCPIYFAATECNEFCQSELCNIRHFFGDNYKVERTQHILSGESHKCVYQIRQTNVLPTE